MHMSIKFLYGSLLRSYTLLYMRYCMAMDNNTSIRSQKLSSLMELTVYLFRARARYVICVVYILHIYALVCEYYYLRGNARNITGERTRAVCAPKKVQLIIARLNLSHLIHGIASDSAI